MSSKQPVSQLPFDLSLEPSVLREDIAESKANALALSMIDAWPNWPGHVLILAGPVGSGKTHIANAWLSIAGGTMISAEKLGRSIDSLQSEVVNGQNIVVEDAGLNILDENALFHLLNTVRQEQRHCLITSRTWPLEWGVQLPDLLSRLKAAQVIELEEPDDLLLTQVMIKLFADRQLAVDQRVVDYCVLRMERSLGSAARLVSAIDSAALSRKTPVTRAIAAEALNSLGMN